MDHVRFFVVAGNRGNGVNLAGALPSSTAEILQILLLGDQCIQTKLENKPLLQDQIWTWPQERLQFERLESTDLL